MSNTTLLTAEDRTLIPQILRIAYPMIISQASHTVMLFVDRLFLSRLGKVYLSASYSGGLASFVLTTFFAGVVGYVAAMVAQYYGADRKQMCTRSTTQAFYIGLASYPFLLAMAPFTEYIFSLAGQSQELVEPAGVYARILLIGSVFMIARFAFGSFFAGIGRTRVVMAANIAGAAVNVPVNYVLIFGKLGFPALGIRGAAYGTILGGALTLAILGIAYVRAIGTDEYRCPSPWRFDRDLMTRLLKFGVPAGVTPFLGWMAFNLFVQSMHSYSEDVAASVTIAFNWDTVAFVPMLGMGVAATAIVGRFIGAKDHAQAQRSAYLTLGLGAMYAVLMIVLFVTAAGPLVEIYAKGFTDSDGAVRRMAATMLRLVSLYGLANASALVMSASLRAAGDTVWVMRVSTIVHWVMAITAVILIRIVEAHPYVVWCVFIVSIMSMGVLYFLRFRSGKWKSISLIDDLDHNTQE